METSYELARRAELAPMPEFWSTKDGRIHLRSAVSREQILVLAAHILEERSMNRGELVNSPHQAIEYFRYRLEALDHEVFGVLFLDVDHRVIVFEEMYQGTINGTHVYPREVAKAALQYNAAAVILVHNHPGVSAEPSEADRVVTTKLVHALFLIGVEVLEHIVIGSGKPGSGASPDYS